MHATTLANVSLPRHRRQRLLPLESGSNSAATLMSASPRYIILNRNLLRVLIMTVLLAACAAGGGMALLYAAESPRYRKISAIDPGMRPGEALRPMIRQRQLPPLMHPSGKGEPLRPGFTQPRIYRIRDVDPGLGDIARAQAYVFVPVASSPFIEGLSTVTLRKFASPLLAYIALFDLATQPDATSVTINPVRGYAYWRAGSRQTCAWVDGVWLSAAYAIDEEWMTTMLSYLPYIERREGPATLVSLEEAEPEQILAWPISGVLLAGLFWPVLASRSLTIRPDRKTKRLPFDEVERRILSLNGESRPWKVSRSKPNEFIAEWKVEDRTWQGLFGRDGLIRARALRLRIDCRRRAVRVAEQGYRVRVDGRWTPDSEVTICRRPVLGLDLLKWDRLPSKRDERSPALGSRSIANNGYDISLIKREVANALVTAGWSYQPVLFMRWS